MNRERLTIIVTSLGTLMAQLDATIVDVALPSILRELNVGFVALQWVVSAYTIPLAVLLLTAGRLSDIYGRRKLFVIGLATFTVGSLICACSQLGSYLGIAPLHVLLFGRVIQGAGSAAVVPGSIAIVNVAFAGDERRRSAAVGGRGAMMGLGLALGPLVGGLLLVRFNWNSIFFINVPIGIAAVWLALTSVDESHDPNASRHFDVAGFVLSTGSVLALMLGLVRIDMDGGNLSPLAAGLFVAGVAFLAAFTITELRIRDPLYDLSLFANRSFSGAAAAVFLLSAAVLGLLFFLTLYLQNVLGFGPLETGVALLPLSALVFLTALVAARTMFFVGQRTLVTVGMLVAAGGVALLHFTPVNSTRADWVLLVPSFACVGLGMGLANPSIVAVATGTADPGKSGLASGLNAVARQIGTAFGIAIIGSIITFHYNTVVQSELPPSTARMLQQAGTVPASAAFSDQSSETAQVRRLPDRSHVARIAQIAWVEGFHVGLDAIALMLVAGTVIAFATIRKSDLAAARRKQPPRSQGHDSYLIVFAKAFFRGRRRYHPVA